MALVKEFSNSLGWLTILFSISSNEENFMLVILRFLQLWKDKVAKRGTKRLSLRIWCFTLKIGNFEKELNLIVSIAVLQWEYNHMMAHKAVAVQVVAVVSYPLCISSIADWGKAHKWFLAWGGEWWKMELLYCALKFREYVSQHKKIKKLHFYHISSD